MTDHTDCQRRIAELEAEVALLRGRLRVRLTGKLELARLFDADRKSGFSGPAIARRHGFSNGGHVNRYLRILDHGSEELREAWDAGEIADTAAEKLAREGREDTDQNSRLRTLITNRRRR